MTGPDGARRVVVDGYALECSATVVQVPGGAHRLDGERYIVRCDWDPVVPAYVRPQVVGPLPIIARGLPALCKTAYSFPLPIPGHEGQEDEVLGVHVVGWIERLPSAAVGDGDGKATGIGAIFTFSTAYACKADKANTRKN